ncbi:MAG: tetratricopeptide repeat protein [Anaerolineales bacterium]|nr:tetratricopeptide repeat protein [Anaerolineales bacterium]
MNTTIETIQPTDLQAMKEQGRALLNANQVEAAIQVYLRILREHPDDVEAHFFLGDCYLNNGYIEAALLLYHQALERSPENETVKQKIQLVEAMKTQHNISFDKLSDLSGMNSTTVPSNPKEVAGILQEITSQEAPISEEEVMRAAKLLDEIIHNAYPARVVAERLEEIDDLLPALLELNIRQARADGRYDLVEGLLNLLRNINLQRGVEATSKQNIPQTPLKKPFSAEDLRIRFINPDFDKNNRRLLLLKQGLKDAGCEIATSVQDQSTPIGQFDIVIAHNPHCETWMMEMLAEAHGAKVPVILSVDNDLEQMPVNHPEYEIIGLGTSSQSKAYAAALLLADMICVPSESLANIMLSAGYPTQVIPDGWPDHDELWKKPAVRHSMINLGWVGSPGQVEDVFSIRRIIVRVMREFPHVCIVVGGDPDVYRLFDTLPETKRIFLPSVNPEDYPYLLRQMDILLSPYRNTPFNRSRSDQLLVDAGALGIPWIGSPIASHVNWNAGGLIANSLDEWHTYLRQYIMDTELRLTIGNAGVSKAADRKMSILISQWLAMIQCILE